MILTTIAVIWLTVATIFVLALAASAAKPVPQPNSMAVELAGFSLSEDPVVTDDAPSVRLYCGRSVNLLNGRISADNFRKDESVTGQRGGMAGLPKSNDPSKVVSF